MATTYEKGRTKQYSRVSYGMSGGGRAKKRSAASRKKPDEQLAMEEENRMQFTKDLRARASDPMGSVKDAGMRIMRALRPSIEETTQKMPTMKRGGSVRKYAEGGKSEDKEEKGFFSSLFGGDDEETPKAPKVSKPAPEDTEEKPAPRKGMFGGYRTRQEQLDAMELRKGGKVNESKEMMRKEIGFMKKKGAPKSMIRHEKAEMASKKGKKVKRMVDGGQSDDIDYPVHAYSDPVDAARYKEYQRFVSGSRAPLRYGFIGQPPTRSGFFPKTGGAGRPVAGKPDTGGFFPWGRTPPRPVGTPPTRPAAAGVRPTGKPPVRPAAAGVRPTGKPPARPTRAPRYDWRSFSGILKGAKAAAKGGKIKAYAAGGDLITTPGAPTRGKAGEYGKGSPRVYKPKAYKSGGMIDGVAIKGKTRCKRVRQ